MQDAFVVSLRPLALKKLELAQVCEALAICDWVHAGLFRDDGESYRDHPVKVACAIRDDQLTLGVRDSLVLQDALLHDVLEDAKKMGINPQDVAMRIQKMSSGSIIYFEVDYLTHKEGQPATIYNEALLKTHQFRVLWVKIRDRIHNLATLEHRPLNKQKPKIIQTERYYFRMVRRLEALISCHVDCNRLPEHWMLLPSRLETELRIELNKQKVRLQKFGILFD